MEKPIAGYGWFIKRIDNALAKEASRSMQARDLTMQQNHLIVTLGKEPSHTMSLKALEEHFCAAQSTVAGLVSRMEAKGLVQALSDPSDRRVKLVQLTPEGQSMYQAGFEDVLASERRMTALLTEEEKEQFLRLLEKVYEAVK